MLGVGEGRRGVMFGLQGREAGSRKFLRLQMRFCSHDRGLGGIVFGRTATGCAGGGSGHNSLAGIAHFLHRGSHLTAKQTDNSSQNNNEPRHRVARH
jgi:hypothetical protein